MMSANDVASRDHPALRFIVIADSHIRPPDQDIDTYASNAWLVKRNEFIVELCNSIDASFVVHLGDIVHPLPVEPTHEEAIALASDIYKNLRHPIHFVAGNHDVGDKPGALVAVPAVIEENYEVFERAWGPSFRSFDADGSHFVIIDAQVLNSGLDRESEQRSWLESDLATASKAGQRTFLFTHYPPFVRDRDENEHYDNIGEPARSWLLDLCDRYSVEAMFSGHVHTFLFNRYGTTNLYVAPSTGFVRPDYAEVAGVPPRFENGRDDPPKLGLFVVDVSETGHVVRPIRSFGSIPGAEALPASVETALAPNWKSAVGVTFRHGWKTVTDFPTAGLDEFRRKRIRNDALLLALLEARIRDVRVPIEDLVDSDGSQRMRDLTSLGMRFTAFSAGIPDMRTIEAVRDVAPDLHRWEIIASPDRFDDVVAAVSASEISDIRMAIAPIVSIGAPDSAVHHFVAAGFNPNGDEACDLICDVDDRRLFSELVFRLPATDDVAGMLERVETLANTAGRQAVVIAELPRAGESSVFDDDELVADRVSDIAEQAMSEDGVAVFLDGFMDHDRGYYPRHGLIDRAFNPRRALYRLIEASAG